MSAHPAPGEDPALRRTRFTEEVTAATGIDEAMIATLVQRFYAAARDDLLLGPVFAHVRDWDRHIARITDFWSSVALMSGRYHGNPLAAHLPLLLGEAHFSRWLALWAETAKASCPPSAAERFILLAQRIAASLSRALAILPNAPAIEPDDAHDHRSRSCQLSSPPDPGKR